MKSAGRALRVLVSLACLTSCHDHGEDTPGAVAAPPLRKAWFEVELSGTLEGAGTGKHRVVFVAREPCDVERIEETATVAMAFLAPESARGDYGTEAAAREGSAFHVCAFALDDSDRLVAFGKYAKNPVVVHASEKAEVELDELDIVLRPVERGRPLPPGRYRRTR